MDAPFLFLKVLLEYETDELSLWNIILKRIQSEKQKA